MTTNCMYGEALVLDQTYFVLEADGSDMFQELVDNLPPATAGLRRMLMRPESFRTWAEISVYILAIEKEAEGPLEGLLVEATQL